MKIPYFGKIVTTLKNGIVIILVVLIFLIMYLNRINKNEKSKIRRKKKRLEDEKDFKKVLFTILFNFIHYYIML